jgi:hypothetical protein
MQNIFTGHIDRLLIRDYSCDTGNERINLMFVIYLPLTNIIDAFSIDPRWAQRFYMGISGCIWIIPGTEPSTDFDAIEESIT